MNVRVMALCAAVSACAQAQAPVLLSSPAERAAPPLKAALVWPGAKPSAVIIPTEPMLMDADTHRQISQMFSAPKTSELARAGVRVTAPSQQNLVGACLNVARSLPGASRAVLGSFGDEEVLVGYFPKLGAYLTSGLLIFGEQETLMTCVTVYDGTASGGVMWTQVKLAHW